MTMEWEISENKQQVGVTDINNIYQGIYHVISCSGGVIYVIISVEF